MLDTPRSIQIKFDSNWSSSVRRKEFRKLLTMDNDNRRQVMEIAHVDLGKVSLNCI